MSTRPLRTLTLILAGCKGPRLDWQVEKCTELGVTRLIFAEFARSVVHVGASHVERLRRTAIEACKQCRRLWLPAIEACKQCGRLWLPAIEAGLSLTEGVGALLSPEGAKACSRGRKPPETDTIRAASPGGAKEAFSARPATTTLLVADPAPTATMLDDWLTENGRRHAHLAAVIGPEGGLTNGELAYLQSAHAMPVCLAPHILRVETAAVASAAVWAAHNYCI